MNNMKRIVAIFIAFVLLISHSICHETKKYNRYLAHIFNKYGSGGTMSFEGLEHLMYNLGLGQLEFNPTHTIDEHRPNGYAVADVLTLNEYTNDDNKFDEVKSDQKYTESTTIDHQNQMDNHEITSTKLINNHNHKHNDDMSVEESAAIENLLQNNLKFREMHDPNHRHPRHKGEEESQKSANVCLSPKSLLRLIFDHEDIHTSNQKLYKISADKPTSEIFKYHENKHNLELEFSDFVNSIHITPLAFMKLCPALLVQIDQNMCVNKSTESDFKENNLYSAWIYSSLAILILSMCGVLGIALVPLMKTVAYQEILKFLVAVAVGTLSGDALMHLLPHALSTDHSNEEITLTASDKKDHNEPVWICACTFVTAVFMYIVETILPLIRKSDSHSHNHNHCHSNAKESIETNTMLNELRNDEKIEKPLTPVAFMVVIGDGLHNLTDGLAIGAAFASQPVTGMATAFAVLCHELPHELGDFALLLQTGVSLRRAICLNIVSSVLSFIGMAIGLLVAGVHTDMVKWIYAGTAGSFLYIAFADLIPAMNNDGDKNIKNSLIQVFGILFGGGIMILIALNEDSLRVIFE